MLKGSVDLESYLSVGGDITTLQALEEQRTSVKTREELERHLSSMGWDLSFSTCPYNTPLVISVLPDNVMMLPSDVVHYDTENYNTDRRPIALHLTSRAMVDDDDSAKKHEAGVTLLWEGVGARKWTVYLPGRTVVVRAAVHRWVYLTQSTDDLLPPYVVSPACSTQYYEEGLVRVGRGLMANCSLKITKDDGSVLEWRDVLLSRVLLRTLPELPEGQVYNSLYLSWLASVLKTDWLCTLIETTRQTRGLRLDRADVHRLPEDERRELSEVGAGVRPICAWLTLQGL